ncbi:hypothetical protein ACHHV8_34625 [Paenibacillus sp. TAB 01]|uniref:hypothetical protein n=1 Tax=Paenibacillus sp. TAB 01 TaxID=3368988 RepID=UPI00375153AD
MKLPYRLNMFSKMVIVLFVLLLPVLLLYTFSNRTTSQVVQDQIQSSNLNQLSFFLHQLDTNIDNLSMFPVILANDPYIREFIDKPGASMPDRMKAEARMTEKLGLQSVSSGWSERSDDCHSGGEEGRLLQYLYERHRHLGLGRPDSLGLDVWNGQLQGNGDGHVYPGNYGAG